MNNSIMYLLHSAEPNSIYILKVLRLHKTWFQKVHIEELIKKIYDDYGD